MWSRQHVDSTTCANNAAGATPVACKFWLMPEAQLGKLRANNPAEQYRRL